MRRIALRKLLPLCLCAAALLGLGCGGDDDVTDPPTNNHPNFERLPGNGESPIDNQNTADTATTGSPLPPGWEPQARDPQDARYFLIAGTGPTAQEAIVDARAKAAEFRETRIEVTTLREFLATTQSDGSLEEAAQLRSVLRAQSDARIKQAEQFGESRQVRLPDGGATMAVRLRITERDLFPLRALQDLLAARPADGATDAWLADMEQLAGEYLAQGEVELARLAFLERARQARTVEAYLDYVRAMMQLERYGWANQGLELCLTLPGATDRADVQQTQTLVQEHLSAIWETFRRRVRDLTAGRSNPLRFRFTYVPEDPQPLASPFGVTFFLEEERHVTLLWIDADGVFRWPWDAEYGPLVGSMPITAASGGTVPGEVQLIAIATVYPPLDAAVIGDGVWAADVQAGEAATLARLDAVLDYLRGLTEQDDTWVASAMLTFE